MRELDPVAKLSVELGQVSLSRVAAKVQSPSWRKIMEEFNAQGLAPNLLSFCHWCKETHQADVFRDLLAQAPVGGRGVLRDGPRVRRRRRERFADPPGEGVAGGVSLLSLG